MTLVRVEKLAAGAVLAEEVRDVNDRLLIPKGKMLEEKHFRILKMWGIFDVQVEGEAAGSDDEPAQVDTERLAVVSSEIKQIFSQVDMTHPAVKEVVRLSVEYRLKNRPDVSEHSVRRQRSETKKSVSSQEMMTRIDRLDIKLPEVPSLVYELNDIIADPMSSARDISKVVEKSPSLTATLLKIVNSAFYGFRSKIDSISRAVTLIGSKELSSLAMGITIMETFKEISKEVVDVGSFLEHNLACGMVARIMGAHSKIANTEQLFVSGMLHDIGRLVLCKYFPQNIKHAFAVAAESGESLLAVERSYLGCTHTQLGKRLLKKWKLPYALENSVSYHHNPSASPNPELAAILQMADMMVHGLGIGNSGERKVPSFDAKAWQSVHLPVTAFRSLVHQAAQQVESFRDVLSRS